MISFPISNDLWPTYSTSLGSNQLTTNIVFVRSIILGERWLFVLFILVKLLTITVETFFFYNQVFIYILTF